VILLGLYWEVWAGRDELVQIAMAVWSELPQVEVGRLIDSVKARLQAVMNAHGEARNTKNPGDLVLREIATLQK
jgi:hypothetical protein